MRKSYILKVTMATYKIPQNVEAEDKLLGPLTFKQFIYAIITAAMAAGIFVGFQTNIAIGILFIPPTFIFSVLAFYKRPDQDVEKYLIALLGFWFKPHLRIWNNKGIAEHVIITAPKKIETNFSDSRSRVQVKSQLKELAKIVDTRGWSTKHVEIQPDLTQPRTQTDDRLVGLDELRYAASQTPVSDVADVNEADDIMDADANRVAHEFDTKSQQTVDDARKHAIRTMQQAAIAPRESATKQA